MSCLHLTSVGAYVLGALDPADRAEFESHLNGCATCRAELLRMAPLPGLLHRISLGDFEDQPAIDDEPDGEPVRVVELPREQPPRKRRRFAALAVAAATVAALAAGVVFVVRGQLEPEPEPGTVSWSATDQGSGVSAEVELADRPWGTEVKITLHDVPPGKPCKLVVRDRDGYKETAGWWSTSWVAGEAIPGSTSIDLAHIAKVEVVTDKDRVLVSVDAPS
ncbi:anti-sigma factor family protein [Actinokineospora sp. HUAS TT18]|uniref:anti-sigma factor family protein n=1 Tax=Actinokineospora sp. HUAS TT18 TaxID=3447451 RepID=UPI003F51E933